MPLYEYICANGHRTEVMHGIYADGPAACPVCGAAVRKAFVAPTFVFKGSGWAKMDRRSSSRAKKASGDDASGGDNASDGRAGSGADETKTPADTSADTSKPSEPSPGGTSSTTKASVTD